jgi:hypothetical protein
MVTRLDNLLKQQLVLLAALAHLATRLARLNALYVL